MLRFVLRRLASTASVAWFVVTATFALLTAIPDDPMRALLGPHASEQSIARARAHYCLDDGVVARYGFFVGAALRGDLATRTAAARGHRRARRPRVADRAARVRGARAELGDWRAARRDRRAPPRRLARPRDHGRRADRARARRRSWSRRCCSTSSRSAPAGCRSAATATAAWPPPRAPRAARARARRRRRRRLRAARARRGRGRARVRPRADRARQGRARGRGRRAPRAPPRRGAARRARRRRPRRAARRGDRRRVDVQWPGLGREMLLSVLDVDLPVIIGIVLVSAIAIALANLLADVVAAWLDPRIRSVHEHARRQALRDPPRLGQPVRRPLLRGHAARIGPYLALLGASATAVGIVSGTGEALGYGLRYFSGTLADRDAPLLGAHDLPATPRTSSRCRCSRSPAAGRSSRCSSASSGSARQSARRRSRR